jgi:hypothetical protein
VIKGSYFKIIVKDINLTHSQYHTVERQKILAYIQNVKNWEYGLVELSGAYNMLKLTGISILNSTWMHIKALTATLHKRQSNWTSKKHVYMIYYLLDFIATK